nr:DUF2339 domain-containing protein [Gammaproteobacteria bacterium]
LNKTTSYHPFVLNGWLAWPMAFAVAYYLLSRLQHHHILQTFQSLFHNISLILLVVLITLEGAWQLDTIVSFANDWGLCWWIIPATLALWLIITAHFWPFSTHQEIYQQQAGVILSLFLLAWGLKTLTLAGNPIPIPWIPLLNPLDISLCLILLTLVKWWQTIRDVFTFTDSSTNQQSTEFENNQYQLLIISVVGLILLWLNFTLFRIAHHWFGVPYTTTSMYNTSSVQTAVSILWTLSGVLLTVYAYREQTRNLWIAGAVLLGLAVLKLFLIDLSELGSLARIISFLVVGILLTSIGYFAPLPDKNDDEVITAEDGNKHRQDI